MLSGSNDNVSEPKWMLDEENRSDFVVDCVLFTIERLGDTRTSEIFNAKSFLKGL